jgi:hypothetical protein
MRVKTPNAKGPNPKQTPNPSVGIWGAAGPGIFLAFGVLAFGIALNAAEAPPAKAEPVVRLPPMLVEESVSSAPWLYVQAGGSEFLSRCSTGTTRELVDAWLAQLQLVRTLVPEEFWMRMDVPAVFVLYAQDIEQTVSAEIQREIQGSSKLGSGEVNLAPSMRLADRDMHASIAYVDELRFDAAGMSIAPGHVRYLLRGRVPELPLWVVDGIERMMRAADLMTEPITLRPMTWLNFTESNALSWDATRPRTTRRARRRASIRSAERRGSARRSCSRAGRR